ncbi:hypothetical protein A6U87_14980 [Rhizobium sp. AC44/96]|uniref:hypothetical protein n=1 Tax=Rhizobium sp. AC44/96 TaxID=1841654 RepID=UPI00080FF010|nr:hypothetical protein [Rhizobium sp. AC44/96]OCJ05304.1 hypothetical protein A6U87_14980 [Rhizobium sp. AC44/96]
MTRIYRYAYRIYDVLCSLASMLALFALTVVRTFYATTWHSLQTMKVEAFKVIGQLKREYAESYDTHGLSLDVGRMRT